MPQLIELNSWSSFKSVCITTKGLNCQYSEAPDRYDLYGPDKNGILWHTSILKTDPAGDDQSDFETNSKSSFNGKIVLEQLDSDGASMSRTKVAPSGWNFNLRMAEFVSASVGSLVNNNAAGTDIGDVAMKFYDVSGVLITDPSNNGSCVKSILDIEPPYDIYVAGGAVRMVIDPTENVYVNVIGVPDVPANYGGSKPFVQNVNLRYIDKRAGFEADGRAAKWLQYSATYHTNKLRFQFTHPAGYQLGIAVFLELYKQ